MKIGHKLYLLILTISTLLLLASCSKENSEKDKPASLAPPKEPPAFNMLKKLTQQKPSKPAEEEIVKGIPLRINMHATEDAKPVIIFSFNQPMVESDKLNSSPYPEVFFNPSINGQFTWVSSSRLTFTPNDGEVDQGQRIDVTIPKAVPLAGEESALKNTWTRQFWVPYMTMANKVASWRIQKGLPRYVSFLNWNTQSIGQGPLFLLYDQKIDIELLKKFISVYYDNEEGTKPKFDLFRPSSAEQVTDQNVNLDQIVALQIKDTLSDGEYLTIEIPTWKDGAIPEMDSRSLLVKKHFRLDAFSFSDIKENGRVPLRTTIYMNFNSRYKEDSFKQFLKITPEPKSLNVYNYYLEQEQLTLELDPGTKYRITIDTAFSDILGNTLFPKVDTTFLTQDLPPLLKAPEGPLVLDSKVGKLPIKVRNVQDLKVLIYKFKNYEDFYKALKNGARNADKEYGLNEPDTIVEIDANDVDINEKATLDAMLPIKGFLFTKFEAIGTGSESTGLLNASALVQNTEYAITSKIADEGIMAWVTDLQTSKPVQDADITIYGNNGVLGKGKTDSFGVTIVKVEDLLNGNTLSKPIMIVAEKSEKLSASLLIDNHLSKAWQFGLKGVVKGAEKLHAAIFTERGVYRPGDTVRVKFIIGGDKEIADIDIKIKDPRGQQLLSKSLSLDNFGSAHLKIPLKDGAAVGKYMLQVNADELSTIRSFSVEEYRVPSFQVKVESDKKSWKRGKTINAVFNAEYLHGGKLDGRSIKWKVLREPSPFAPRSFPKYRFTFGDPSEFAGVVTSDSKRLNADSKLHVSFTAEHPSSAGPMTYIVEGTVQDIDRQAYAGRTFGVIHPANFYIGVLPPPQNVLKAGQNLNVPIIAVKPDGTPLSGVQVRVRLKKVDYHTTARLSGDDNVQMSNREVENEYQEHLITISKTASLCKFNLKEAGQYRLQAWAQDIEHQTVLTGFDIVVTGDNPVAWPRFDAERIEVIADKPEYKIGDTATLVVQTPYEKATGLLTLERGEVIEQRVFTIDNNTPAIKIPINDKLTPNVFASVILVRGRIHNEKDALGFETGAPGFKIGYANLKIEPTNKKLIVSVNPRDTIANPGQESGIDFIVKDANGMPVPGKAVVMVVDEAVLGLTGYNTPKPVGQLYAERVLGVRTGSSLLDLPHSRRERFELLFPGGDADKGSMATNFPMELRSLFKSTAYWNPDVAVDAQGKGSVQFKFPDNLTTYRVMVIAYDSLRRAGSEDEYVKIKKPLMVKPVTPRFLYANDELNIEALIYNGSNKKGDVQLTAKFKNIKITDSNTKRSASINSDSSLTLSYPVKVTGSEEAIIRFDAVLGEHKDAVEIKIPILNPGTKRTVVESKPVSGESKLTIEIPKERVDGTVKMEVVTSSTVLSELKGAVQYLMRYPNGCIEQTTSTAYPLVVLKELLPEIGVEVNQADLKKFSEAGIRRILSFQTSEGGLSYWPGGNEPHAFATAFGLTALIEAKKKGYDIPDDALDGMADYLEASLRKGAITGEMPHGGMADGDTRALFVMTLGRLGRPQPNYISALWRKKSELTPFGLSFLAIAVKEMPSDQSLLEPILAEIKNSTTLEEKEAYYTGSPKGGWSMDSPLRTHASALIAYSAGDKNSDMPGKLLKGFLNRRRGGMWGNTQENVFGIMGIHTLSKNKAGGNAPTMELAVNGKPYMLSEMQNVSKRVKRLSFEESDMGLSKGASKVQEATLKNNGATPIYLTMRATYEVPLNEKNRMATSNGFTINRTYETIEGKSLEGKDIDLGSLVRVRLNVKTDKDHHYVAIDDKLPAGLEPLNTNLKTTERVSMGKLSNAAQRSISVISYQEIRDERVAFYVDEMLPGEYEFIYVARATTAGNFLRPCGRVEAMYQPDVCGTSKTDNITVK